MMNWGRNRVDLPMEEQIKFIGGPVVGQKCALAGMSEIVAVPVDAELHHLSQGQPFAMALYRHQMDEQCVNYHFLCFERPNKEPFEAEFADGPNQGIHLCSQPPHFNTKDTVVPLKENGEVFADEGVPSAVALYKSKLTDGRWRYHLDLIEDSGENVERVLEHINKHRAIQAINHFYLSPNYSIYSMKPNDKHPQILIEHGHRRAYTDEKIAPLVKEIWKKDLDTLGSCQERDSGKAYIGFPLAKQGELFHEKIAEAGIDSECKKEEMKIRNPSSGEIVALAAANVSFSAADIPRITALVSGCSG
jgi:hypothetical protein